MDFFFVRDHRLRPRFYSAGPIGPLPARFSKTRAVWEKAKKKVTGLNPRILVQEQAFEHGGRPGASALRILHAGCLDDSAARSHLSLFLQRQRRRHVLVLAGETVLLPFSGLAMILPGPNIAFYALAVLMIIQWQALRGINRILRRDLVLVPDPLLAEWEATVEAKDQDRFPELLARLETVHGLPFPRKLLWR
jgi:hypothetical protein